MEVDVATIGAVTFRAQAVITNVALGLTPIEKGRPGLPRAAPPPCRRAGRPFPHSMDTLTRRSDPSALGSERRGEFTDTPAALVSDGNSKVCDGARASQRGRSSCLDSCLAGPRAGRCG